MHQRMRLVQRCVDCGRSEAATDVVAAFHSYARRQPGDDVLGCDGSLDAGSEAPLPLLLLCCRETDKQHSLQQVGHSQVHAACNGGYAATGFKGRDASANVLISSARVSFTAASQETEHT